MESTKLSGTVLNDLPQGAVGYYASRDEAIEQGGVLAEIALGYGRNGRVSMVYGVYSTQQSLCQHALAYTRSMVDTGNIMISVAHLLKIHTPLSRKKCLMFQLPGQDCSWFDNEMGGLTAFTLRKGSYMVRLFRKYTDWGIEADICFKTSPSFYGVFKSAEAWDDMRYEGVSDLYEEPPFPFVEGNLDYDRCRCTLMGVENALHKPPVLHPIPKEQIPAPLIPYGVEYCFSTKEEALKMAGLTFHVTMPQSNVVFYAVFPDKEAVRRLFWIHFELCRQWPFEFKRHLHEPVFRVISLPEDYGVVSYDDEGWNPRQVPLEWSRAANGCI
jgi:hypothetical protein